MTDAEAPLPAPEELRSGSPTLVYLKPGMPIKLDRKYADLLKPGRLCDIAVMFDGSGSVVWKAKYYMGEPKHPSEWVPLEEAVNLSKAAVVPETPLAYIARISQRYELRRGVAAPEIRGDTKEQIDTAILALDNIQRNCLILDNDTFDKLYPNGFNGDGTPVPYASTMARDEAYAQLLARRANLVGARAPNQRRGGGGGGRGRR